MGIWESIQQTANDVGKQFDNLAGTNTSGRGGGLLADASNNFNRSDIGKYTGGLATSGYRFFEKSAHAGSDILRGDFKNAGKNAGMAAGAYANVWTLNARDVIQGSRDTLNAAGKYTFGLTEDLVKTADGLESQEKSAYVSDTNRDGALRFGSKAAALSLGVHYASEIGAYGYNAAVANPTQTATVAYLASQGKAGQAAAATMLLGGLPDVVKNPLTEVVNNYINPATSDSKDPSEFGTWKNEVVPGTGNMPVALGVSSTMSYAIVAVAVVGAIIYMKRKK